MSLSVAIVEDNAGLLAYLAKTVNDTPDLCCVVSCADAETALDQIPASKPDVVLMDIKLPGMSGIECVSRLKKLLPDTQIMMLTVLEDHERIFQSLKAGATGYLLKAQPPQELIESIRVLHAGGSPMSNSIARKVVQAFRDEGLTDRERQVLECFSRGRIYKEVADELGVTFDTVRTHVQNIYKKLHVRSKAEAVQHFRKSKPGGGG